MKSTLEKSFTVLFVLAAVAFPSTVWARKWTDKSGKFSVEAELVKHEGDQVTLRKADGQEIMLRVDQLSIADQSHLKSLARPQPTATQPTATRPAAATPTATKPAATVAAKPVAARLVPASQALAKIIPFNFQDVPLVEAVAALRERSGANVYLDVASLQTYGVDPNAPVTLSGSVRLADGLRKILDPLKLDYVVRYESLLIAPVADFNDQTEIRTYQLLQELPNFDAFVEDVVTNVAPTSWDENGGPGSIRGLFPHVVVRQTDAVHRQLAERYVRQMRPVVAPRNPPIEFPQQWAAALRALSETTVVSVDGTPLDEVVKQLATRHKIDITFGPAAAQAKGFSPQAPVSMSLQGVPLSLVLDLLLRSRNLAVVPAQRGLEITERENAVGRLNSLSYNVQDLLARSGDYDAFSDLLTVIVDPNSWQEVGGKGTINSPQGNGIVFITQSFAAHQAIQQLLSDLRTPVKP